MLLSLFVCSAIAKKEVVDKIVAIIYHQEGSILICQSDLRTDLSGKTPTLREALLKELIVLDGKKLKILISDDEVDRSLARVQEHLKMTREELQQFFKEQGFTLEQARKELAKSLVIEHVIEARIKAKSHVSKKVLEQYHKDNPHITYRLKQAFVPFDNRSKELVKAIVQQDLESGAIEQTASWIDLGAIQDKDFSSEKAFIKNLPDGKIVVSAESQEGITLLKLVSKKVATFEERKNEIAQLLGQKKFADAQAAYYDSLLKDAHIRYIDAEPPL